MTDIILDSINSGYNLQKINDNFEKIEDNINNTSVQSTDGNNVMQQDLDMNSNDILNLPKPLNPTNPVRLMDLTIDGLQDLAFNEEVIDAVNGVKTYTTSNQLNSQPIVHVDGRLLNRLKGDFKINISTNEVTLEDAVFVGQTITVWTSPVILGGGGGGDTIPGVSSFQFAAAAAQSSLADIKVFTTYDGLVDGDSFGATFAFTGNIDVPKAATIEIGSAKVYDIGGREFIHISKVVYLETLGLSYSEPSVDVLSRIVDLRDNGFVVKDSPEYGARSFNRKTNVGITDWEKSCHRGFPIPNVENTMQGFTNSQSVFPKGANVSWECDVQITSDGVPVVFHDDTVDADTTGTGAIADMTLAQVQALRFPKAESTIFAGGIRIPTFDRFVQRAATHGVKIVPEIKQYRTPADIEIMASVVLKYHMEDLCTWTSFQVSDLQELRKYDAHSQLGWAATSNTADLDRLKVIEGDKPAIIFRSTGALMGNPALVDLYKGYGFDVMAYTANLARDVQTMAEIGVRKIFTDENI